MVQRRAQVVLALLLNVVLLVDVIGGWTVPSEPGLPDADDDSEIIDADTDLFDSIPSDTDPEETCPGRQSYRLGKSCFFNNILITVQEIFSKTTAR